MAVSGWAHYLVPLRQCWEHNLVTHRASLIKLQQVGCVHIQLCTKTHTISSHSGSQCSDTLVTSVGLRKIGKIMAANITMWTRQFQAFILTYYEHTTDVCVCMRMICAISD